MRLYYSENEESVHKPEKLGKAAWQYPACTGQRAQNVQEGTELQWDVAKQVNFWTSPDFAQYRECLRVDINALEEKVTVCTTMKQDVEFIKVVYHLAEAVVVTFQSPKAVVSTGAGLILCATSDDAPPIAKSVVHELVKSSCRLRSF